ncbi:hypothetical protein V496_09992 [Pseudogymnoascus sp. VKM F-4515 (FW-2607)]|nr:hypothetical protein V496_09992 [Pseudogymnoascus sp. VKM F-4515 (FW-2607)]KFY88830.1 hypothetical protein V498_06648 [Pseudogymnoascus sp. VKM F-4517 (FW-2822)]
MITALLLFPLVRLVLAICEGNCSTIIELLSQCSLPPLTVGEREQDWALAPGDNGTSRGTTFISLRSEAECFCIDARHEFDKCWDCYSDAHRGMGDNDWSPDSDALSEYKDDCSTLGFHPNDTLAYVSTTRTSMPSSTPVLNDGCDDTCGVLRGQIDDCNLTPLDTDKVPKTVYYKGSNYEGSVILNRTAGECVCTVPVSSRFRECTLCLRNYEDKLEIAERYEDECEGLGYYFDNWPDVEEEDKDDGNKTTDASPEDKTDAGQHLTGSMVTAACTCLLSLLAMYVV